ncbi:MAG TPA: hypothetical protein VFU00_01020, partial [Gemmatimonadales bacterium]|nr:hypothetical protein [Gemmatimonadales bacterium]
MSVRRFHPSIPAIVFVTWWVVAAIVFPHRMLNADGDMLRHISHGRWMLEHGRLITEDPFSFSKGGQPFVAFEYGSQLIYASVFELAGLAGVAIFAALLIATAYALLARFLLRRGVDPLLAYLATIPAAVLGAVHWVPRPHLFTLVAVVVLLSLLETEGRKDGKTEGDSGARFRPSVLPSFRLLTLTAILFATWANLHGGFLFGLVLIGMYLVADVAELLFGPTEAGSRAPSAERRAAPVRR